MSTSTSREPVVAVVGATASGKSALALDLAERLGGEIVNTDSMQVYRGMDIGTAKLPVAERRGVPHHLIDVLEVSQPATVAEFQQWARAVVADCHARGVVPVLVGGSPLYTRAVLDEFEFPGTDPAVRARLEAELAEVGAEAMHRRLADVDPAAAGRVLPSNGRRVVRALEVVEITGRPFTRDPAGAALPLPGGRPGRRRHRRATSSTSGSSAASTRCGSSAWSRRCARCCRAACARGVRRAGRSATSRCSRSSTAS